MHAVGKEAKKHFKKVGKNEKNEENARKCCKYNNGYFITSAPQNQVILIDSMV